MPRIISTPLSRIEMPKIEVEENEDRSYAKVRGILLNKRNVPDEDAKVKAFADERGISVVGVIPRSDDINRAEEQGMTVVQMNPELPISQRFIELAKNLIGEK